METTVGGDARRRTLDGFGQHVQFVQLDSVMRAGRHLRGLAGQGGQDGEVVDGVLRARCRRPPCRCGRDRHQTFDGQLEDPSRIGVRLRPNSAVS